MPKLNRTQLNRARQQAKSFKDSTVPTSQNVDNASSSGFSVEAVKEENPQKYQNRKIIDNWAKYEAIECLPEVDATPDNIHDFAYLVESSGRDSGHFKFSTEKDWDSKDFHLSDCNLFKLDLRSLSDGLACIPFYTRIGIDIDYLSHDDKVKCDDIAEKNLTDHLRKSMEKTVIDDKKVFSLVTTKSEPNESKPAEPQIVFQDQNLEDWLDSVLDS